MLLLEHASFTCNSTKFVLFCSLNCSLLLSLNKEKDASLAQSCESGMLCRGNSSCGSVTACKPASVLRFAVQMRGGSVCSHWPCQQMVMRSLAGEYNRFLSVRVGSQCCWFEVKCSCTSSDVWHGTLFHFRANDGCLYVFDLEQNKRTLKVSVSDWNDCLWVTFGSSCAWF